MAKTQIQLGSADSVMHIDRPAIEWSQILLHLELNPYWSFLFDDGAHHKKPHSPAQPKNMILVNQSQE